MLKEVRKKQGTLPTDKRLVRALLIVLSGILMTVSVLGIVSLIVLAAMVLIPQTFSEGIEIFAFYTAIFIYGLAALILALNMFPSIMGYRAARRNKDIKKCLIVGIIWCVAVVPLLLFFIIGTFQSAYSISYIKVIVYSIGVALPVLWTTLIGALFKGQIR